MKQGQNEYFNKIYLYFLHLQAKGRNTGSIDSVQNRKLIRHCAKEDEEGGGAHKKLFSKGLRWIPAPLRNREEKGYPLPPKLVVKDRRFALSSLHQENVRIGTKSFILVFDHS